MVRKQFYAPTSESQRLLALYHLRILDTPSEERFDRITRLAKQLFDVPIVLISLLDKDRLWLKPCSGMIKTEIARDISFYSRIILREETFVVPDTLLDEQFAHSPLVIGEPKIRFYAGHPLAGPDNRYIGTLCIIDHRPRHLNDEALASLRDLAAMAESELNQIELGQQILQLSETRYQAIVEDNADLICRFLPDTTLTFVNETYCRYFGKSRNDLIGLPFLTLIPQEAHQSVLDKVQSVIQQKEALTYEHTVISSQGKIRWQEWIDRPILDANGQVVELQSIGRDITERKQAEAERDQLFNLSLDLMGIANFDGYFEQVNPACETLLGYTAAELTARRFITFVHPDDVSATLAELARLAVEKQTRNFENRYRCKDGRYKWLSWVAVASGSKIYAVARDVTEPKQVEQALIVARDRALEVSQIKSALIAKVSHELRTPLSSILGFAEMLQEGIYGSILPQQREGTRQIIESTHYLHDLVNDLLDQAQLDAGEIKLALVDINPQTLLTFIETKMQVLAINKGLTLTAHLAPNLPPTIKGDAFRLKQILVNLVGNAIKFTPIGTVQVLLSLVDPHQWAITVTDTGIGIPSDAQERIFAPFEQVDDAMTRSHTGTGLGLSIVKQLTLRMEGDITVESMVGQGSKFIVTLPLMLPD